MTRFYLALVVSIFAGIASMIPNATAQTVASGTCANFRNAKEREQQAPYLASLQAYRNTGSRNSNHDKTDAVLAEDAKRVRDWCGKNLNSTYREALAAVFGPPRSDVPANAAIGLLRNHLFPSPEIGRIHALEMAKARQQIRKLPISSTWAMPPAYAQALHGKQPPPAPDPANVWFPIGPAPISYAAAPDQVWNAINAHETGRIISIAPTPLPQGPIYAGGEFGGVWVYDPSSAIWTPLTDDQVSPQIGAIAIDPDNWQTIYAGTGENSSSAPCGGNVFAQGILKSTNGGSSWVLVGANSLAGSGIGRIVVGHGDVFAATSSGIYLSSDGGNTWSNTYSGCVYDMAFSAVSATTMYAATPNGLIESRNTGMTWSSSGINQPMLPASFGDIYHTAIGVGPGHLPGLTHQDVIYVSVTGWGNPPGKSCSQWAPFRSPDGGQTWSTPGTPPSVMNGWCVTGWANSLAVDPADSNLVAFGGGWLYIYNAGANIWCQVGIAVAHGDMRALAFDALERLYVGNDGGVWEVPDPTHPSVGLGLNDGGLQVTEFYPGLGESQDGSTLIAGSQDNGIEIYQGSLTWNGVIGGDGAAAAIDQNNAMDMFAETLFGSQLQQSTVGGTDDSWKPQQPSGFEAGWNFPLAISPAPPGPALAPTALYIASEVISGSIGSNAIQELSAPSPEAPMVWTTLNQACPGQVGSNGCSASVAALGTDPLNPTHIFAGWSDGTVNFSIDAGNTWASATPSQKIAGGITAIAASPADPYSIAATTDDGHVWVGEAIDTTSPVWTDDTGNLPVVQGIGLNAVLYSARGLVVASDSGVFEQQGGLGNPWATLGQGLPNTKIEDLQWKAGDLVAITYGRGAWEVSPSPTGSSSNYCQFAWKYNLCYLGPTIQICSTNYAICHPVCDFPCNRPLVSWTPLPFSGGIDPWLDGTSLNVLAANVKQAREFASGLQVVVSTKARTEPVSERRTSAELDDHNGLKVRNVVVVGPSIVVSAKANAALFPTGGANSADRAIVELSLPYERRAAVSRKKIRMVKFDELKGRWVDVGLQSVRVAKHVVAARVSSAGRFTIVAEVPSATH